MSKVLNLPRWENGLNKDSSMPRRISNSETSAYLQCERKWLYGYHKNLEPVTTSTALSRGIIGHEILAAYYRVLMDAPFPTSSVTHDRAESIAFETMAQFFSMDGADVAMLADLRMLLVRYFTMARADGWKILAVEQSYDITVNDEFGYVMRLDLLADIAGKTVLVDHKIIYNFYSSDELDMNAQMPKYIGALKHNGIDVDYAMLNMIRHRQKKGGSPDEETFQRVIIRPAAVEIKNVMREQFKASQQIIKMHNEAQPDVLRTMNQMTCKNCSFLKLCKAELMGQDIASLMSTAYRQNTYNSGYNPLVEEDA